MTERNYFIDNMNPFLKLLILILITIIGSLDFKPYASSILIISGIIIASIFSSLSILEILNSVKGFIIMSVSFMFVILAVRYISGETLKVIAVLGLGFRIILISIYTSIFVKTTDPTEFVISLIKYLKMPPKIGYAFLTAYRFLPTFKEELQTIKYAHEVRGIVESKNPFIKVWNSQRYILPMMANAVRKGIRISMAMETRAFDKYKTRTYYRELHMPINEIIMTTVYILYIISVVVILYLNNLVAFAVKYVQ
ncbi:MULTISPECIES: energy-coupling factor transporter transmembrane component T [Clostridium]|uniref:Cobalt ABC transporter permease n=2 Tax=Clostridium TaxID=1485 RepID=A0A0D1BU91_CLOBO|nr:MULTISPECIES: energy-coupling factor transporter transmembrane component T [Clostridium]MDU2831423.1 energy-coupling factor transporter transmembrane component T [Clostridium botulinum]KIS23910.1 cobalt ABC transporter permease [Clostridium botulinum B2 450]MDU4545828.1 energy-coupling factor transporter transmembrane component T [Clostridium botulinum]MDU5013447.1 energy-coupling factor transporter transmembrane component T [Clostridium botulinum]MDU5118271.1 energy-coupling factor transpo